MGEMHRGLQEAAIGVSGREENSLSPPTQKNDNDNAIRKIINKGQVCSYTQYRPPLPECQRTNRGLLYLREFGMSASGIGDHRMVNEFGALGP